MSIEWHEHNYWYENKVFNEMKAAIKDSSYHTSELEVEIWEFALLKYREEIDKAKLEGITKFRTEYYTHNNEKYYRKNHP